MAMSPDDMIAFVDRLYGATAAGDWDTAAEMMTDDFVAHEADGLPMAGTYHGVDGFRALFTKVMGMCDVAGLDRTDIMAGTDHAVAILSFRFADPDLAPAELCETFRFRDGKCCEIKPYYYDPAPFWAAVEAKKKATA